MRTALAEEAQRSGMVGARTVVPVALTAVFLRELLPCEAETPQSHEIKRVPTHQHAGSAQRSVPALCMRQGGRDSGHGGGRQPKRTLPDVPRCNDLHHPRCRISAVYVIGRLRIDHVDSSDEPGALGGLHLRARVGWGLGVGEEGAVGRAEYGLEEIGA